MRVLVVLSLIFIQSCSKWHDVQSGYNGILFVKDINPKAHSLKEIDWKVGKKRGATVSKGISFQVEVPRIDKENTKKLAIKHGVDSWIYKITKIQRGSRIELGKILFLHRHITRNTNTFTISIFYHAAAISQTFRRFHCPAFNHRLRLYDPELTNKGHESYDLFARFSGTEIGKVVEPTYAPIVYSGGHSLVGDYIVEIALFDSKTKKRYSKYQLVDGRISINNEHRIKVPSCVGVKEENNQLKNSRTPRIEDLQIK